MKQLTVEDLKKWCDTAIKSGYGKKKILVAGDEEGNSFHCLYDGFSLVGNLFEESFAPMLYDMDSSKAKSEGILLG